MYRILVVDDVADTAKLLAFMLRAKGYDVLVASNGPQALQLASAERPDMILLDVMMPGMDGIEVCKRIRADADLSATPVLLVTAKNHDEDFVAGLDAGADDYVTKPFIPEVLAARVRAAIRAGQSHREIARVNEQLRLEIADRKLAQETLQKRDDELRQAQKMEAVGLLAGGIAHEFNNLLQAIRGYATCAMEGLARNEQRYSDLKEVLKATDKAATLTRQLLGFSRRNMLQPTNVDVNELVADMVKMVKPLLGSHIEVQTVLAPDAGTIFADPSELHQVLLNLCINARDAMPSGGSLALKTENVTLDNPGQENGFHPKPGRYVLLTISDNGCGMLPEVMEHIFEPFFTTKGPAQGTGLGLAMVYGIVQQHGGTIHVESKSGQGTTFKLYLPAGENVENQSHGDVAQHLPPRGIETILFAEDDPMVQRFVARILTAAGYSVFVANDGEEALQLFNDNKSQVSLVILDEIMPKLTGQQVYRRIKELCPETKAIFCTGYNPETAGPWTILDNNLRVVKKPFDEATLLHAVRNAIDGVPRCEPAIEIATEI